jgi:hypothetical protein
MIDIHPEHTRVEPEEIERKPRLTVISLFIWLGIVAAFGMLIVGLSGCASDMRSEVCYLRVLGKTEEGYTVVAQACQSPERFAASQR